MTRRAGEMTDWAFAEEMRRRMRENPRVRRCEECGKRIGRWREHPYCDAHERVVERRGGPRKRSESFGLPALRAYRESLRISREVLAGEAGVSVTTITQVERGNRRVGKSTARKLAMALGELLEIPGLSVEHLEAGFTTERERRSA